MLRSVSSTARIIIMFLAVVGPFGLTLGAGKSLGQVPSTVRETTEPNDPNAVESKALVRPADAEVSAKLTVDALEARKKQATEVPGLAEDMRSKLVETYDEAIAQLKLKEELSSRRRQYEQATEAAPTALSEIKNALAQTPILLPSVAPDLTLAQAERELTKAVANLEETRKEVAELEDEPKRRAGRRTEMPEESSAARRQLEEIQSQLAAAAAQDQPSALAKANRLLLQLQQDALEARLAANSDEIVFYDAAKDLLASQRDMVARRLAAQEELTAFWQEKVSALRQEAAEVATEEAVRTQQQTQDAHPLIREAAAENADLARAQTELVRKIEGNTRYAARVDEQLAALEKDFADIRDQVEKAGRVTNVLGLRLLSKRNTLPATAENRRRIKNRPSEIAQIQLEWIEYDRAWSALSDIERLIESLLAQTDTVVLQAQRDALCRQLSESLQLKREILKTLSDLSLDYSTRLANIDTQERTLVRTVDAFADFIDSHVLWVKSSDSLALSDLPRVVKGLAWLVSPANWETVCANLWDDLKANLVIHTLIALVIVSSFVFHRKLHHRIEVLSENVRQVQTDSLQKTVRVLVLTLVVAVTWPIVLFMVAWRLVVVGADDFSRALATGMFQLILPVFTLGFLHHLAKPHGLAREHFRMREEALVFLRRHLRWFSPLAVSAIFIFEVISAQQVNELWYGTVGRLSFIVGLVGLAVFVALVLRPTGPLMEGYLGQRPGGWFNRLRHVWYPLCLLLPLVLAILAGMGYVYGARHLTDKLLLTMGLILVVLLAHALFVRSLVVAQRRLALLEYERRQAMAKQERQDTQPPSDETPEAKTAPEPTIFEMSQQTRRLIGAGTTILLIVGLWYLWRGVLPALAKLGEYHLYTIGEDIITLGAVTTALAVTVLTGIVARNVPGLLEIAILRRLPLDRGARFAITTISRYLIVLIGVLWAFSELGIGWSKIQWLIAAMTVGLGFGLQEIFANFVSGLIILFEQPIRVDDIVTVANVTGRVTTIRIRATTIRRWDQRELIVPNREFITGQLINWTLSDNTLRREFAVGIAYGSDIRKAERILYAIAQADSRVLKEPAPVVVFKGFGDNSLDFELRVYFSGIEQSLSLWHDLNVAIDDRFREAGTEIAFPQHDLHLRSIDPDIRLPWAAESSPDFPPRP